MKKCIYVLLFSALNIYALNNEQISNIKQFIKYVKNNDKENVAKYFSFPFDRSYPVPSISDKKDLINRYKEIFDDNFVNMLTKSNINSWEEVGWRGIMFDNGLLWMDESCESVISINYQSNAELNRKNAFINKDKQQIYVSLNDYESPVLQWKTKHYLIRIDKLSNGNYRYAAWPDNSSISKKPDIQLENGVYIPEGSGGNHRYEFKNGSYKYTCSVIVLGTADSPSGTLVVTIGDKEVLSENVIEEHLISQRSK